MQTRLAHRVREWSWIIALAGAGVLFLASLTFLIVHFQLASRDAVIYGWRDPTEAVRPARVRPDLALLPLAGVPSDEAVREALRAGEPDSAFAILVYATDLDSATQGGLFALVGERFAQAGRLSEASLCFQLAHDLAALAPNLADIARFDMTLSAARGRLLVDDRVGLALSLEQMETLIRYSAFLQPVQRRQALERLVRITAEARGKRAAEELRARLRDDVEQWPVQAPRASLVLSFAEPLSLNPALERVRLARQQRAFALIRQWIALEGGDVGPERADLAEFLRREDNARVEWYAELLRMKELTPGQKITLLSEQVAWLLVKWQAARGAFGISLVSEWEGSEPEIRAALAAAQAELFTLLRQQAGHLADPQASDWAQLEVARLGLVNWRLGRYPEFDARAGDAALVEATKRVRERLPDHGMTPGSGVLPVPRLTKDRRDYILVGGPVEFGTQEGQPSD